MVVMLLAAALSGDVETRTVTAPVAELRETRSKTSWVKRSLTAGRAVSASSCREGICRIEVEIRGRKVTGYVEEAALSPSTRPAVAEAPARQGRLMRVGVIHHGEEVVVRDGDPLLVLCRDALVEAKAQVDPEVDEIVDGPGQKTGRVLRSPGCADATWAFSVAGLRSGPVQTAIVEGSGAREGATIRLGARMNKLFVRTEGDTLKVALNGNSFATVKNTEDAFLRLEWAGDLDGDGALDLLLDLATGGNESIPTLFLSTAGPAGIPAPVASHHTTGC